MEKLVIPSSRTGKAADVDAMRVEVLLDGKPVAPFTIDGVTVDFKAGYYALSEDLDIIMASFVQKKRRRDPKPDPKPPSSSSESFEAHSTATNEGMPLPESNDGALPDPGETPGDSSASTAAAASSDEL